MSSTRPTVAVIIPTYNSERTLGACLESLLAGVEVPAEIVVVDDTRTTDATRELALAAGATLIVDPAGMARSRNLGAAVCSSDVLVAIDSDMVVGPRVIAEIADSVAAGSDAVVIGEKSFGPGYWTRARALDKAAVERCGVGVSLRAATRRVFDDVGGYDETLEAGEDADFDRRVRATGARVGRVADTIGHDEGRVTLTGAFRKKRRYGQSMPEYHERTGTSHFDGAWRRAAAVAAVGRHDPLAVPGVLALKVADAAGALVGARQARR